MRSFGSALGSHQRGHVRDIPKNYAESWEEVGYVEILDKPTEAPTKAKAEKEKEKEKK